MKIWFGKTHNGMCFYQRSDKFVETFYAIWPKMKKAELKINLEKTKVMMSREEDNKKMDVKIDGVRSETI